MASDSHSACLVLLRVEGPCYYGSLFNAPPSFFYNKVKNDESKNVCS